MVFLFLFLFFSKDIVNHGFAIFPVIVYDNKNLHITELEDTRPAFILFYLLVIKYNDPAVKIWLGRLTIFFRWPK